MSTDRKDESKRQNNNHPVAVLVDVDKTLLLGRDGSYNMDLINALKKAGHNKIYLFTSMTMRDIVEELANPDYSSRPKLVAKLKQEGIDVIKVLTPADVVYNQGIGAAYDQLFLKHHQRIGKDLTVDNYSTDETFNADRMIYSKCHSEAGEVVKPATEKSKLYEYFLSYKPLGIISSIVIDDLQEHLTATSEVKCSTILNTYGILVKKDSDEDYFKNQLSIVPNLYMTELNKRAQNAAEQKHYDAACRYFEISYLLADQAKLSPEKVAYLIKNISELRIKAKSTMGISSDSLDADNLYSEIVNANPILIRIRKIQLNIDLFKHQYGGIYQSAELFFSAKSKEKRNKDFQASILNPCATLIHDYPEVRQNCLNLFRQIQPIIPDDQYKSVVSALTILK